MFFSPLWAYVPVFFKGLLFTVRFAFSFSFSLLDFFLDGEAFLSFIFSSNRGPVSLFYRYLLCLSR